MIKIILVCLLMAGTAEAEQLVDWETADGLCDQYVPDDAETCKADIRSLADAANAYDAAKGTDHSTIAYKTYVEKMKVFIKKYPLGLVFALQGVEVKEI